MTRGGGVILCSHMAESRRFVIIEDRLEWQAEIRQALQASGHIVLDRATTLQAALALVPNLKKLKTSSVFPECELAINKLFFKKSSENGGSS